MQKQSRFSALDGLRGFAAMGVFFFHGADIVGFKVASGYLAVDFFFCLSGFIIAAAYERRLLAGEAFSSFMTARLTRLYPVYLLGTAIGLLIVITALLLSGTRVEPLGLVTSLALGLVFLPSPPELVQSFATNSFPFVMPAWSLSGEIVANVVYAATVRFLRIVPLVLFLLLTLSFLVYAALSFGSLDLGADWVTMAGGFVRSFFSFFAGVLVFRLRPCSFVLPAWMGWVCIVGLIAVLQADVGAGVSRAAYDLAAATIIFPALILAASAVSEEPRNSAIFSFLGAASYPLYILHRAFLIWVRAALINFGVAADSVPQVFWIVAFALVVLASARVEMAYERPVIGWLRAKFAR
jgi:peptidoglycan/LPS O-acetylase OafA/YrhL